MTDLHDVFAVPSSGGHAARANGHPATGRGGGCVGSVVAVESTAGARGVECPVEFRILGPLEVRWQTSRVPLGGARQRVVLAALLADANRVISVERLIGAVWDETPPLTARQQIRTSVSALRRVFSRLGASKELILTCHPGYVLEVGPGELDANAFEAGSARARQAAAAGDLARAASEAQTALRLWRGPALDGVTGRLAQTTAAGLEERRLALVEERFDWELALGRHQSVLGELTAMSAAYPLRERLVFQLMLALYRDGRQSEALVTYQRALSRLREELGLDPGAELQQLQYDILRYDPGLDLYAGVNRVEHATSVSVATPSQLPMDIADFTGRTERLADIAELLTGDNISPVVITGRDGVGKTALAVHVAHQVVDAFPDGQLYVNLQGGESRPVDPGEVLARLLRALAVPGSAIPQGLEERAVMYRSQIAGKRVLIVLDDAADETQLMPLLPGGVNCGVIVTSRNPLSAVPGARLVTLDALEPHQAVGLLAKIISSARITAEPAPATELAMLCEGLPLALRIAGAKLAARPHWTIARLVERLADKRRRLDELRYGAQSVRTSIALSYQALEEAAQVLFRRLGLIDSPDITPQTAASLLGTSTTVASDLLDSLADAQLLQATPTIAGDVRYCVNHLVEAYAHELAHELAHDENIY